MSRWSPTTATRSWSGSKPFGHSNRALNGASRIPPTRRYAPPRPIFTRSRSTWLEARQAEFRRFPLAGRRLAGESDSLDHLGLERPVAPARRRRLDRFHRIHPLRHLTEDGVFAVQPRGGIGGHDEELRAVRVRPCVRHGERATDDLVLVYLVLERVSGAAGAGTLGATALDHEVGDHPMEDEPVVEAVPGELPEVRDGLRRVVVEKLDRHGPGARVQGGLRHAAPL